MSTAEPDLEGAVKSGLTWSALNSLVLRLSSLLVGIVLARLLTPEQFGTFAVALTVQTLVMSLGDLGLGTQLIRTRSFEDAAPTIATLGALSGLGLAGLLVATAPVIARAMGSVEAGPAIAVLGGTIALGGLGVVPFALLQRRFSQGLLLAVTAADFVVGTSVSIVLVVADQGALGLALGRLAGQGVGTLLLFVVTRRRPVYAWDASMMASATRFGLPIALANVLSWATLGLPTPVIAHHSGTAQLGLYVLAFNVSSWPMTVLGQAVRAVALPAFSRTVDQDQALVLRRSLRLTWAVAAPCGVALAVLAEPVVRTLYGDRWVAAWPVLAALGIFGALRVAFDMVASFLLAHGSSRWIFVVQLCWLVTLLPALAIGVRTQGILGAAVAQVVVSVVVTVPLYLWGLRRVGIATSGLAGPLLRPTLAALAAGAVGWTLASLLPGAAAALAAGALGGAATYAAVMGPAFMVEANLRLPRAREAG